MHNDAIEIAGEKESIIKVFEGCQEKNRMIK